VRVFSNLTTLELSSGDYPEAVREIELGAFPVIDDFAIELRPSEELGHHIFFVSKSRGELAGFPYWDNVERDMRHFVSEDVPLGSLEEPVDDADEDWQIVIFEHAGFVYVMEGAAPHATSFDVWFRVATDRYIGEWGRVIDEFNPIAPLA
jgi:hypothetical protein